MVLVPAVELEDGSVMLELFEAERALLYCAGLLLAVLPQFIPVLQQEALLHELPQLEFEFNLRQRVDAARHECHDAPECQPRHQPALEQNVGDEDYRD